MSDEWRRAVGQGWYPAMRAKEAAVREAPPTRAPSTSGQRIISSTYEIASPGESVRERCKAEVSRRPHRVRSHAAAVLDAHRLCRLLSKLFPDPAANRSVCGLGYGGGRA